MPKLRLYSTHKRYLSLFEVLISMVLVSILLTTLMGMYAQFEWMHVEVDQARRESFELRYVQGRLAQILPKAISSKNTKHVKDFYFYTSQEEGMSLRAPSLVFSYNNDVDIDPLFSNHVLGRLFLEETEGKKQLVLATWPIPRCALSDQPPMHKEVLLDQVSELAFSFYTPPPHELPKETKSSSAKEAKENIPKPATNTWQSSWLPEYKLLPALVKVQIRRSVPTGLVPAGEWLEFAYPLPKAAYTIMIEK